jgi:chemotaxis protein methyltransferase CheR
MIHIHKLNITEFQVLANIVNVHTGIHLKVSQKHWVEIRLSKRVQLHKFEDFSQYIRFVQANIDELKIMLNLITINETSFFREKEHFDFLSELLIQNKLSNKIRVLSAASSIGAEAYSAAMILQSHKKEWEIIGTDINEDNIHTARTALYPMSMSEKIPNNYLKMYCLKGHGNHKDYFLINKEVLENVQFYKANLVNFSNEYGIFDIIFLRNVLIYFDDKNAIKIVKNVTYNLKKGGFLIISHTEYLALNHFPNLKKIKNSIYQKVY